MTGVADDPRVDALDLTEAIAILQARPTPAADLAEVAADVGLHSIDIVAWRDLDDPEAGGSELHAAMVAERWAAAGLDVSIRTSAAGRLAAHVRRDGYQVVRKGGRHALFPRVALRGAFRRRPEADGLVEIWNGMPFFSPLWSSAPRVVFLHHVHDEMWPMTLHPRPLAWLGRAIELRVAPPVYRRSRVVTLSASSRAEIIDILGFPEQNVTVVPPGVDHRFRPGGRRSAAPMVLAVGRLAPVKRFPLLIDALVELRQRVPDLHAVIAGDGNDRAALVAQIRGNDAEAWLHLPGHVTDTELVGLYRRAWIVASASAREGWGMTLTEAAACGTAAVATRIAGHADAVAHGRSGLLVDVADLADAMHRVLADDRLRARMSAAALLRAADYTWDRTAYGTLAALVREAEKPRRPVG